MNNDFKMFEADNLFDSALKSGITFFCGAGFSVNAYDKLDVSLPVGIGLLNELKAEFQEINNYTNLSRACTKLMRSDKTSFYKFLKKRFEVKKYDLLYMELLKIKLSCVYTTNIDDLFFKLFQDAGSSLHLIDRSRGAELNDEFGIDYFPLHGCIKNNSDYVFGATEIASAFSQSGMERSWERLAKDSSQQPILFWGWNFEDAGPIEAMYGKNGDIGKNINKWVLLYEPKDETIDFLKSLGFNIIIGETIQMLKYIQEYNLSGHNVIEIQENLSKITQQKLINYTPPKNDNKLISYKFEDYFIQYAPQWSHIYSEKIPKTKYFTQILDLIMANMDIIVLGIRASGKTTLMMQLIHGIKTPQIIHYMSAPSLQQVNSYLKIINNKKVILFVDDCFRDTDSVIALLHATNVQVIFFDRDHNYESQFHKLTRENFEKVDITEIGNEDAQSILNIIPQYLKKQSASTKNFRKDPTMLNLLAANLKMTNFNFINKFYEKDKESARVFLMICYVHSCGVPCSFDMIYSFLEETKYSWTQMYDIIRRVGGLINEYKAYFESNVFLIDQQDYFECRSRFLAERIIQSIPNGDAYFADVMHTFLFNVPRYKICMYDKFKKAAYDSELIYKTFNKKSEGIEFYEEAAEKDDSEYIYQQAALYFSKKKDYKSAFEWIDKAKNLTNYNRFSIESTYAQIYFDVNSEISEVESLDALNKLKKCCTNDKRKNIHFSAFAKRTLIFYKNFPSENSMEFLKDAMSFIKETLDVSNRSMSQNNKWEMRNLKREIEKALGL